MRTTMTLHESQDGGRFLAARNGMDAAWRHHESSSRYLRYRLCAQCDLIELCTVQLPNVRRCVPAPLGCGPAVPRGTPWRVPLLPCPGIRMSIRDVIQITYRIGACI